MFVFPVCRYGMQGFVAVSLLELPSVTKCLPNLHSWATGFYMELNL
jgi:hypothetical protein